MLSNVRGFLCGVIVQVLPKARIPLPLKELDCRSDNEIHIDSSVPMRRVGGEGIPLQLADTPEQRPFLDDASSSTRLSDVQADERLSSAGEPSVNAGFRLIVHVFK